MTGRPRAESALVWCLLLLLGAGILYPLLQVLRVAVIVDGMPSAAPLLAFFARPLFREALLNSVAAGVLAVALGSLIAVPLALVTVRYSFPGRSLLTTLGLLPLSLPGYAAGALLTFIRVIDDLGTPLMLNYTKLLAPQAYVRVTTVGLTDVDGYVICAVLVALSLFALWISKGILGRGIFTSVGRSGAAPAVALGGSGTLAVWAIAILLLGPALLPHLGIAILSVSKVWSLSPLPSVYTLSNYGEILFRAPHFIWNTVRYALLAAALDVGLGAVIAWLLLRGQARGRQWLDAIATMPLAVPGVVLAVGYLRVFHGWSVPGLGAPLTSTWLILVIVYAVRRLPYTVRGAYAALQQLPLALEEAAQNLGANRARAFVKVTLPLMGRGLLAGGLLAFVSSAVDLSSTILLVPHVELEPLSYGIYVYMQSAVGRGPGAALGVVAIVLVAAGTWLATRLTRGGAGLFRV